MPTTPRSFSLAAPWWLATVLVVLTAPATGHGATSERAWPPRLNAHYKVSVAGFDLGSFTFAATVKGATYELAADAKLSWGLGLYTWTSTTRGAGAITGETIRPDSYKYDYKLSTRTGGVRLAFKHGDISSVEVTPKPEAEPAVEITPLSPQHLKNAFDPISALLVLARKSSDNPCDKRISVFEGKQRFELVMSFLRQEKIKETRPSGQPALAFVCRVRYLPVAGHKKNKATQAWADNTGMEVALRPVPSAHLLVPHRMTIPTPFGTATIMASHVEIVTPGDNRIALGR